MVRNAGRLPAWVTWQRRPFPDANLLLLRGRRPALVDSGSTAHAEETAAWVRAHSGPVALVVNTHWHSDHVGGTRCCKPRALVSRPAPRTLRLLPGGIRAAAKRSTSTSPTQRRPDGHPIRRTRTWVPESKSVRRARQLWWRIRAAARTCGQAADGQGGTTWP